MAGHASKNVLLIYGTWQTKLYWDEARPEFEARGYAVHTPDLRYHDLPLEQGVDKIATLSLTDYTDDLVKYAESLDSPPLIVGHSLGGLLALLVAAKTSHVGVVAACPAPAAGIFVYYLKAMKIFLSHFLQLRPWAKPLIPRFEQYFYAGASRQPESEARRRFAGLVSAPVLAIGAEFDNAINPKIARDTAEKLSDGRYVEIAESDHMLFFGEALPAAMVAIDQWVADKRIFV